MKKILFWGVIDYGMCMFYKNWHMISEKLQQIRQEGWAKPGFISENMSD